MFLRDQPIHEAHLYTEPSCSIHHRSLRLQLSPKTFHPIACVGCESPVPSLGTTPVEPSNVSMGFGLPQAVENPGSSLRGPRLSDARRVGLWNKTPPITDVPCHSRGSIGVSQGLRRYSGRAGESVQSWLVFW